VASSGSGSGSLHAFGRSRALHHVLRACDPARAASLWTGQLTLGSARAASRAGARRAPVERSRSPRTGSRAVPREDGY
jgi:hypothetical protein